MRHKPKMVTEEELLARYAVHVAEQVSGIDSPTVEEMDFDIARKIFDLVEAELGRD